MDKAMNPATSVLIVMVTLAGSVFAAPTIDSRNSVWAPATGRYSHTCGNFTMTAGGPAYPAQSQWLCQLADEVQIVLRHMCVKDSTGMRV